ncbi:MAG: hypothetical protein DRJ98_02435 [Thermoprotei archaeon]|nr:MAG: hypothetical protein DRJ98_02435 [Thermoprotei archaeon]RLF18266.1 MAG: hypothetical protein DRN06_01880 [Thermoprotei archaeon]
MKLNLTTNAGAKAGFIAILPCIFILTSATLFVLVHSPERLYEALSSVGLEAIEPTLHSWVLIVSSIVIFLPLTLIVVGVLLGALYNKLFGAKENKAKAVAMGLALLAFLILFIHIPIEPPLSYSLYAASAFSYSAMLYPLHRAMFNVKPLLHALSHEELELLKILRQRELKLREIAQMKGKSVEELSNTLSALEDRGLVELTLDKSYRLTDLGKVLILRTKFS